MKLKKINFELTELSVAECTEINGGGSIWGPIGYAIGAFGDWCARYSERAAANGTWVN